MVSFTALLSLALLAASSLAAPSYPPACKEVHPKDSSIKLVQPYFTPTKTTAVIRKEYKSSDDTLVQVKHLYENNGTLLLIKTKKPEVSQIELGFQANDDKTAKRYFKIKANDTCYVPTKTDKEAISLKAVSYYKSA